MREKIYISPSSQPANTYAVGNTNEQEQCRRIGAALNDALKRCGFDSKVGLGGTMYTRVAESNAFGADLHVPIHTNAFNGQLRGTRMFCSSTTGEGGKACKAILAALAPLVPGESDNVQAANYYEITATKAPCAYVEAAFHDNADQAAWIIDHVTEIGEAICQGICNYYGVEYIPPESVPTQGEKPIQKPTEAPTVTPENTDRIYRVQVGAFHNRDYAVRLRDELKAKGYDAFVVEGSA